jgi:hypothetical protein
MRSSSGRGIVSSDLVEHDHRVIRAGPPHRLHQPAGHRADISAAVAEILPMPGPFPLSFLAG